MFSNSVPPEVIQAKLKLTQYCYHKERGTTAITVMESDARQAFGVIARFSPEEAKEFSLILIDRYPSAKRAFKEIAPEILSLLPNAFLAPGALANRPQPTPPPQPGTPPVPERLSFRPRRGSVSLIPTKERLQMQVPQATSRWITPQEGPTRQ